MATGLYRVMVFFDGSNFLSRLKAAKGLKNLDLDKPPPEAFKLARTLACWLAYAVKPYMRNEYPIELVRAYWVGSFVGNEETKGQLEDAARVAQLEPVLFKRAKRGGGPKDPDDENAPLREKGVDMALAIRMLTHAFNDNFDAAVLVAGDEDYAELAREVMRYGPRVMGGFFSDHGMSDKLRRALDRSLCFSKNGAFESDRPILGDENVRGAFTALQAALK